MLMATMMGKRRTEVRNKDKDCCYLAMADANGVEGSCRWKFSFEILVDAVAVSDRKTHRTNAGADANYSFDQQC